MSRVDSGINTFCDLFVINVFRTQRPVLSSDRVHTPSSSCLLQYDNGVDADNVIAAMFPKKRQVLFSLFLLIYFHSSNGMKNAFASRGIAYHHILHHFRISIHATANSISLKYKNLPEITAVILVNESMKSALKTRNTYRFILE